MRKGFEAMGLSIGNTQTPIIPIIIGEDYETFRITMKLLEEGVYVNPVVSPAVEKGRSLLRTSYTPTHTREQLEFALGAFERVLGGKK
jgi:7-keto-8-aminopelargonate synthetase-like enzyme